MSKPFQRQISADSGIEVNKDVSIFSAISEGTTKKSPLWYETKYDEEMIKTNTSPPPNFRIIQERDNVPLQNLPSLKEAVELKESSDTSWKKPHRKPLDYVVFAGITSLVIPCIGLPALMFALKSRKEIRRGNFIKGWQHSKKAIVLTSVGLMIVALILGILMTIIIVSDIKMDSKQAEAVVKPVVSSTIPKWDMHNVDKHIQNQFVKKTTQHLLSTSSSIATSKIRTTTTVRTTSKGKSMPEKLNQFIFNSDDAYKRKQRH